MTMISVTASASYEIETMRMLNSISQNFDQDLIFVSKTDALA